MRKDDEEPLFPRLREAMRENQVATRSLAEMTYYRYSRGQLPKNLEWFLRYPEMLRALADDAEKMTEEDWGRYLGFVEARAQEAKGRRDTSKDGEPPKPAKGKPGRPRKE